MTRPVPAWLRQAALTLLAALLGMAVGIGIAPRQAPGTLAYCATDGSLGYYPCPPDDTRWVIATWTHTTATAKWTGERWQFQTPIFGAFSTTSPATSWSEIEARP